MKAIKMLLAILIFSVVFILSSCSVNPSKVSPEYAKRFVDEATYVKSETGMCFSVTGTRKTWSLNQSSISHAWVPCELAEKFIKE